MVATSGYASRSRECLGSVVVLGVVVVIFAFKQYQCRWPCTPLKIGS